MVIKKKPSKTKDLFFKQEKQNIPESKLICGDCLIVMPTLEENSIDSIVCDPPYGLSFMGKDWDHGVPGIPFWEETLRVAKPGAFLLAFGGTRTFHRLAVAIEDAGWELRDTIMWVYGTGFPKSLNVGKAIDATIISGKSSYSAMADVEDSKEAPLESKKDDSFISYGKEDSKQGKLRHGARRTKTLSITDEAKQWEGWGTALKPSWEPIIVARKPIEGTVANNVLKYGTGGLNIDDCRVEHNEDLSVNREGKALDTREQGWGFKGVSRDNKGRWPANFCHDGSDEVMSLFPQGGASGKASGSTRGKLGTQGRFGSANGNMGESCFYGDSGSAARFFYCAKASKQDRDEGCDSIDEKDIVSFATANGTSNKPSSISEGRETKYRNNHPTVKPTNLMRYLCRLVTQPGGIILDPFMGSGSTGKAAKLEGFNFIGIDLDENYVDIADKRISYI